jgi:hypothetical protein
MLANHAVTLAKAVVLIFGLGLVAMVLQIAMSY